MKSRLYQHYYTIVREELMLKFQYSNVHEIPKVTKVVVDTSMRNAGFKLKLTPSVILALTLITGQKAAPTLAKKGNAQLGIRKGAVTGVKVTLRGEKMYEFLDRLVTSALPRVRDFNGIKATGFDGRGNYNLGVVEQIIFPEINIDKVNKISGMDITFVTSADTDKEAKSLLTELGLPFKKN